MTDKEKMEHYESQTRKDGKPSDRKKWVTPAGGVIIKGKDGSILVGDKKKYD